MRLRNSGWFVSVLLLQAQPLWGDTIVWTGNGDGADWHQGANWNLNRTPAPGDDVVIPNLPGEITVTHAGGETTIQSLACAEKLQIAGEVFVIESGGTIDGELVLDGGTLRGNGSELVINGLFTWSEGTISGPAVLRIAGQLDIAGDNRQKRLQNDVRIENAGLIIWSATGQMSNSGSSGFDNLVGGRFEIRSHGYQTIAGGGSFNNFGMVVRTAGERVATFSRRFNNHGQVISEIGWITFGGRGTHSGSFVATPTGEFDFAGGRKTFESASSITASRVHLNSNIDFFGRYEVADLTRIENRDATITFHEDAQVIDVGRTLDVREGVVQFETGLAVDLNDVNLAGFRGTIGGTDTVNLNGEIQLGGGHLVGTATYMINGRLIWTGGGMGGQSTTWLPVDFEMSGPGGGRMRDQCVVNNRGTMRWTGGGFTSEDEAVFNNLAGATIVVSGAEFPWQATGSPTFNNDGTIESDAPGGVVRILPHMNNNGAIYVRSGSFELHRGSTNGTITGDSGSTLILADLHTFQPSSILSVDNLTVDSRWPINCFGTLSASRLRCVDGQLFYHPGATVDVSDLVIESDADVHFNTEKDVMLASLFWQDGNMFGVDRVTVSGPMTWLRGTLRGDVSLIAAGSLAIDSAVVTASSHLTNAVSANWSGGPIIVDSASSIINLAGATFTVNSEEGEIDGSGIFVNHGEFIRADGLGEIRLDLDIVNHGVIRVQSGDLYLRKGIQNLGSIIGETDTTLTFQGDSLFEAGSSVLAESVIFVGSRNLWDYRGTYHASLSTSVSGSELNFSADANILGMGHLRVGTNGSPILTLDTGEPVLASSYTHRDGTLAGADTLEILGPALWTTGEMVGSGTVVLNDGLDYFSDLTIPSGRTVVWRGGDISGQSGAIYRAEPGARTEIETDGRWSGNRIVNLGTMIKVSGSGRTEMAAFVRNRGTLEIRSGTLDFAGGFVQADGSTELAGGMMSATGTVDIRQGTLLGDGVIDASLQNAGRIRPGPMIGSLTITGDYTQLPAGRLTVELAGRSPGAFDLLTIGGRCVLGGALDLALLGGFEPDETDRIPIVVSASIEGRFAAVTSPCLPGARRLDAAYDETTVSVVVIASARPGDLNCDCAVDASDIEPFLLALFEPGQYPVRYPDCDIMLADTNGDGDVNALDIEPFLGLLFP